MNTLVVLLARMGLSGDDGVDVFFVLSGFLISFILLKEFKKYGGKIDVYNFYRGRYLRLIPVMIPWVLYNFIYWYTLYPMADESLRARQAWQWWSVLTFTNNWVGTGDQGWSLAVEF